MNRPCSGRRPAMARRTIALTFAALCIAAHMLTKIGEGFGLWP
jgi:hypothetical protein